VVGGGDPLTELLPAVSAGALLDGGSHEYGKEGLARRRLRKGRMPCQTHCKASLRFVTTRS
ncbi:MAG: hypothetical protein P8K91_00740, partial [Synechococcus sp. cluster2_bin.235]|nr:hypothetical protein [Synechococcus sp. cluster2_bin.235]